MMDANDTLQQQHSNFSSWVRDHKLIDIHVRCHGIDGEPPTFARGSRRIDYMLATKGINEYVVAAGILPFNEFCTSDHRALFADIALHDLLKGSPNQLASQTAGPYKAMTQGRSGSIARSYKTTWIAHSSNTIWKTSPNG